MSIVTFFNSSKEESGKTLSIAAIATYMAIEHNYRILIISTTDAKDSFRRCFWEEKKQKKKNLGIFGPNARLEVENGVDGLSRLIRSNKISPDVITNYTKVVFRDRLEILLGSEAREKANAVLSEQQEIEKVYPDIISTANKYYDLVFVDLDENVQADLRKTIIDNSDLLIVNMSQRLRSIEQFAKAKEEEPQFRTKKTLILVGRYDRYSKYTAKNISRYLGEKNQILTIPYNTLYFEAAEEAGVPDLFLKFRKSIDPDDRNAFFIQEVKRAADNIIYRLQDLQMKM